MKNKTQSNSLVRARNVLFACAIAALACSSCKDDDNVVPDEVVPAKKAIIPENGKQYSYKIVDSDGTVETSVTRVKSMKDSTGFPIYSIQNIIKVEDGQYPVDYKAYSNNGTTTYELKVPAVFEAIVKELRPLAYIEKIEVAGYPQYQIFDNKGTVDSPVTFKGGPMSMNVKMEIIAMAFHHCMDDRNS